MKFTSLLTVALAASSLLFASCGNSEKEALASFKTAVAEINTLVKEGKAAGNPADGMPKMEAAQAKMNAIKTDGLPTDLKDAFVEAKTVNAEMVGLMKDMPKDPAAMQAFMMKVMADPKFKELSTTGKAKVDKFKEVAKKYDIEIVD